MAGGKVCLGVLFQIAVHCSREAMSAGTGRSEAQCSPSPDGKMKAGAQVTSLSLLLQSGTTTHGARLLSQLNLSGNTLTSQTYPVDESPRRF